MGPGCRGLERPGSSPTGGPSDPGACSGGGEDVPRVMAKEAAKPRSGTARADEPPAAKPAVDAGRGAVEAQRIAEEQAREEFGIASLAAGEDLIDEAAFSDLQDALVMRNVPQTEAASPDGVPGPARAPAADEDELLLEEMVTELPADRPIEPSSAAACRPPATPAEVAVLEASLQGASERDQVVELVLRLGLRHAEAVGLLVVNKGMIAGLRGAGGGLDERIEGIMLAAESESFFARPAAVGRAFRGRPSECSTDARLLRALGRSEVLELVVIPVTVSNRVVNLLYADNGSNRLGESSVAALCAVARCMSAAYERIILERKGVAR